MHDDAIRELVAAWIADTHDFYPDHEPRVQSVDDLVGATDTDLRLLENRLGTPLPPSYRAFLRLANGWSHEYPFDQLLRPCHRVTWFSEENNFWIHAYTDEMKIPPREFDLRMYTQYSMEHYPERFYPHHLASALQISDEGDSAVFLLNPILRDASGEWEAWFFANWLAGAVRYASFFDLMHSCYDDERRMWLERHRSGAAPGDQ